MEISAYDPKRTSHYLHSTQSGSPTILARSHENPLNQSGQTKAALARQFFSASVGPGIGQMQGGPSGKVSFLGNP
jgi:hypothetical protein